MSPDDLAAWIPIVPWLVALIVMVTALSMIAKFVWPVIKKWADLADDLMGEKARPGVPARPGLMERMATVEEKTESIHHEMFPNSGGSLRDAVDRQEQATARVEEKLDNDNRRISDLDDRITLVINTVKGK